MKKHFILFLLFFSQLAIALRAQDTLPKFSLINAGNNRIIIGWTNKFENIKFFDELALIFNLIPLVEIKKEGSSFKNKFKKFFNYRL